MFPTFLPRRHTSLLVVACILSLSLFLFFKSPTLPQLPLISSQKSATNNPPPPPPPITHHSTSSSSSPSSSDVIPVEFPDPFTFHTPTADEKFLTYLPHSGFHNQRIELENALLLAFYLNRTLLIPDVYLGNPAMPWLRFDKMYERILLQTKRGLDHCPQIPMGAPYPMECLNYDRWTKVPWTFFYDLTPLTDQVRLVLRPDLSLQWLESTLGINTTSSKSKSSIRFLKDMSPYEFRVYDHMASKTPLSKFMHRYDVGTLQAMDETLLHFGSVFGTHRVLAQQASHAAWLQQIRTHLIFKTPVLVETARQVVEQLGGVGSFVGVHLRVGDGLFKVRASINIDDIYHALVNQFTDLTLDELQSLDPQHHEDRKERTDYEVKTLRVVTNITTADVPLTVNHTGYEEQQRIGTTPPASLGLKCRPSHQDGGAGGTARFSRTVIYIATDAPNPAHNPLLRKIYDTFPCVFDLSDFSFAFDALRQVVVADERVRLDDYLIPMLDAIIAAQGEHFFGTKDSTFTSYIERQLHPVYTHKPVKLAGPPVIH
ncbi:hypothetical protein BCR42DRAFT_428324 [Absidia repens]|uniref:GDP-fucose protein O-fucosyltransferase-domain-containing protein n=1 Tax=Absidia repens TaxID=90262 RepID=A0A1X2HYK5_9FUNG|nr:hypothetical protein BCR42DRAFT_428324 [Absidia repens]